jgi:glycosyltransferase involved in cell wall biosynthesis
LSPENPFVETSESVYRIALLCSERPGHIDAIRSYSLFLCGALRNREDVSADVYLRTPRGDWRKADSEGANARNDLVRLLATYDAVVLQYNPFMWGRWGFAPWLPVAFTTLRRSRRRPVIALMVHEPYVPMVNWRWTLMGLWQRAQLESLRVAADVVFASIEAWADMLARRRLARLTVHLPVGANFPDKREARPLIRKHLGLDDGALVLAVFGTANPSRHLDYVVASANALARLRTPVFLLNLGADAPHLSSLDPRVHVHEPGQLPEGELASYLASADIFLAPFIDGVSTRRGSMMAALQHGLPIVGTAGPLTDGALRDATHALRLTPVDNPNAFVEAVCDLARDAGDRLRMGHAARALYEASFDWPILAHRLVNALAMGSADAM